MANTVEPAKTGRARCRTCGEGIAKGEVRFGEEVANAFSDSGGTSFYFHHLRCAAKKKPAQLREALKGYAGDLPQRDELDRVIAENESKQKPSVMPYAERAPSARSHCGECHTMIAKSALRIALPREQAGAAPMMPDAPRYFHAACVRATLGDERAPLLEQIRRNSPALKQDEIDELERALR